MFMCEIVSPVYREAFWPGVLYEHTVETIVYLYPSVILLYEHIEV